MAHESFEDPATAAQMNDHFVSIKVDREERPDIDAVYMAATQAHDRPGRLADDLLPHPGRRAVLLRHVLPARAAARHARVPPAARRRRRRPGARTASEVRGAAGRDRGAGSRMPRPRHGPPRPSTPAALDEAVAGLHAEFDGQPAASAARRSSRRRWCWSSCCATTSAPARPTRCAMVELTCERDGPRRDVRPARRAASRATASTREWVVPHFEKMLYDNALLLRVYAALLAGDRLAAGAAGGRRDRRLPAARPAHRRGRLRLRARRRHRRRRGPDLRVDARPARRRARRRGRGVGGARCSR